VYILVLVYFYFAACRETKYFKNLFIKGFTAALQSPVPSDRSSWDRDFQVRAVGNASGQSLDTAEPATGWLQQNLPSFPKLDRDFSQRQQIKTRHQRPASATGWLQQNLPSFPKLDRDFSDR
jgi:hypothetical protein